MSLRGAYGSLVRRACQLVSESRLPLVAAHLSSPALQRLRFRALQGATLVEAVDALVGPLPRREALAIARRIAANRLRAACVMKARKAGGIPEVLHMVRWADEATLRDLHARHSPAILASWHFGVPQGLGVVLGRLGVPAVVFIGGRPYFNQTVPGIQYVEGGDPNHRTESLLKAFTYLRRGGIVGMSIDVTRTGLPVEVPFLGRRVKVGPGAAALSRLTGAPILPVVKVWREDGAFEVRCFEPLPRPGVDPSMADAFDREVTIRAAAWFEAFIRRNPEQLGARDVARLVRTPPCDPPSPAAPVSSGAPR